MQTEFPVQGGTDMGEILVVSSHMKLWLVDIDALKSGPSESMQPVIQMGKSRPSETRQAKNKILTSFWSCPTPWRQGPDPIYRPDPRLLGVFHPQLCIDLAG